MSFGSSLRRSLNYQFEEVNGLSEYEDLIYFYPRSSYQPTKRSSWLRKPTLIQTEEEALIERIIHDKLAKEEALAREKTNRYYDVLRSGDKKSHSRDFEETKDRENRVRSYSYALNSSEQKKKDILEKAKRLQSTKASKIYFSDNKSPQGKSQRDISNERIRVRSQKPEENVTEIKFQRHQVKTPGKQIQQSKQLGFPEINLSAQQQLKYLKVQLEQKNRKIVDLECKILKQQNEKQSYCNLNSNQKKLGKFQIKNVIEVSILSSEPERVFEKCNQYSITIQKCEQKEAKETKESFFATTADMKSFNIQDYELKETLFLNADHLGTEGSAISEEELSSSGQYLKVKSNQPSAERKESLAQSIMFQGSGRSNGNGEQQFDLTLSTSQVSGQVNESKFGKKLSCNDDDLTLSMSQVANNSSLRLEK